MLLKDSMPHHPHLCLDRFCFDQILIYTYCFQDRAALMSLILEDESKRQKLNGITHPRIFRRMLWEIAGFASRGHNYAVLDVPLLFESSGRLVKWFHKIIGDIYVPTC